MPSDFDGGVDAVQRWLSASIEEAQPLLPLLLALPAAELHRQTAVSPELRSAGVLHSFLGLAGELNERAPRRALELTAVVIEHAPSVVAPAGGEMVLRLLRGQAWRERADALRRLERVPRARAAAAEARALLRDAPGSDWFLATVDLVEAPILHDAGQREAARWMVRCAARWFEAFHDRERYVRAVMLEASMFWTAGDREAAARVWRGAAEAARLRRDLALTAMLEARIGSFELEHGHPEHAAGLLRSALALFDEAGLRREAAHARWLMAEAFATLRRPHEAVSELYIAHADLVAVGAIRDAAVVSARILELLILGGRQPAVVHAAETFARTLLDAGMPSRCFTAISWLERRAAALTVHEVRDVRRYFEEAPENLRLQPHAWTRAEAVG